VTVGTSAANYRGEAALLAAVARAHERSALRSRRIGADAAADLAAHRAARAWRRARRATELALIADSAPGPRAA
jgi:hypothetical protein